MTWCAFTPPSLTPRQAGIRMAASGNSGRARQATTERGPARWSAPSRGARGRSNTRRTQSAMKDACPKRAGKERSGLCRGGQRGPPALGARPRRSRAPAPRITQPARARRADVDRLRHRPRAHAARARGARGRSRSGAANRRTCRLSEIPLRAGSWRWSAEDRVRPAIALRKIVSAPSSPGGRSCPPRHRPAEDRVRPAIARRKIVSTPPSPGGSISGAHARANSGRGGSCPLRLRRD